MAEKKPFPKGPNDLEEAEVGAAPTAPATPATPATSGYMPTEEQGKAAAGRLGLDFARLDWRGLMGLASSAVEATDHKRAMDVLTVLVRRRDDIISRMGA